MSGPVPGEIWVLGGSVLLVVAQVVLAAQLANRQYGLRWAASARDEQVPPPTALAGRAQRALANLMETYPLFVAAVLAVAVTRRLDFWSLIGAHLYLWSRIAYLGLYLAGVPLIRSLVWNVALLGILVVLAQLLAPGHA
ncbi:MAG TPA: MAPEG family protein [Caulobacteraceae bacterium]|nr:MAPEG family protein [Caulobacteraceae bacterium]